MRSPIQTADSLTTIEDRAHSLQVEIYKHRRDLWGGCPPQNLIDIFEPGVALRYLGYSVSSVVTIGEAQINGVRSEVAGVIDQERREVTISERFYVPEKRFTTAHELGHAELHPSCLTMHRDLSLERAGVVRDRREIEANRYASAYLMPSRLLRKQFRETFQLESFALDDATARALCGVNDHDARQRYRSLRSLSKCLAGTGYFNFRHFRPLNEQFKVSSTAMAIRLEELGLVEL